MPALAAYHRAVSGPLRLPLAVAILSLTLFSYSATAAPAGQSVEKRLQVLEDRAEIEELILGAYSHVIDTSDVTALSELFTEDGEYSSEWEDISSMPPPLRSIFAEAKIPKLGEKYHFKVTFRGRKTIANFMFLVANTRPAFVFQDDAAVAIFDAAAAADALAGAATAEKRSNGVKAQLAGQPDARGSASMKHLVTNPRITVNGDLANSTSYWTEISTDPTGKTILAGGGYYTDVLERTGKSWRIRQRTIHNYDEH